MVLGKITSQAAHIFHCSYNFLTENLTSGMSKPCVMDIKIGKITYGPDASQEKKDRESKSYAGTKLPYGYSVCGIIVHSDQVKVPTTFRSNHNQIMHLPN